MYINISYKFHRIPDALSHFTTKVHDLLGQNFSVIKYQIVNSLFSCSKFIHISISVFKMPLDLGRCPREHAKYTVVLENTAGCQQTFCW